MQFQLTIQHHEILQTSHYLDRHPLLALDLVRCGIFTSLGMGCGTFTSFDMVMIHCVSQLETRLETENDFCE